MKWVYIGFGLLATHLLLAQARKRQARFIPVSKLPFNYHAVTIPPIGIFINDGEKHNLALINHEQIHWQQYQQMGLIGYYLNYAAGSLRGYDANPMEQQARQNESDYCRANYTECVRTGMSNTIFNQNFRT